MEKDFWKLTDNEVYEYFGINPNENGEAKFKAAQAIEAGSEYPNNYVKHLLNIAESEAKLYIAEIEPDEKEPIMKDEFSITSPSFIIGYDDLKGLFDLLGREKINRQLLQNMIVNWTKSRPYISNGLIHKKKE